MTRLKTVLWYASSRGASVRTLVFGLTGWLFALAMAAVLLPRIWPRIVVRIPALRADAAAAITKARTMEITSVQWKDSRPLHLFVGDSHIEMGNWYEACSGAFAIRNCGVSRATIPQVTALISAIPETNVDTVVLFVGINDLGGGGSVKACLDSYRKLLDVARQSVRPKRTLVVSLIPLRQSFIDERSRAINQSVHQFNIELKQICAQQQVAFAELNHVVTDAQGGLSADLTDDGIHLNKRGYRVAGSALCEQLSKK